MLKATAILPITQKNENEWISFSVGKRKLKDTACDFIEFKYPIWRLNPLDLKYQEKKLVPGSNGRISLGAVWKEHLPHILH